MGDVYVYDLAGLQSAPLVPSIGRTCWALSRECGIEFDGLVSKTYDAHERFIHLNWR